MYDSGITAKALIDELMKDIDVAPDIELQTYLDSINSLQALLYSEIIRNNTKTYITSLSTMENQFGSNDKYVPAEDLPVRYENIITVYAVTGDGELDRVQLIDSTMVNGAVFPYTFYKYNEQLAVNIPDSTDDYPDGAEPEIPKLKGLVVVHLENPTKLTADNYSTEKIAVPIEFIDLVKAKVRGDIYRLANEGDVASDWITYYNVLLEGFRTWVTQRSATLGR